MPTTIIRILLIVISVFDIRGYMKRPAPGCYGSSREKPPKRIKVKDKDLSHYPHQHTMKMDGMSCGSCVVHVKNTLNAMESVWARVDLEIKEAQVYMK